MDAVQFVKDRDALQEIRDRLSQVDDKTIWGLNSNYGLTEDQIIAKFFQDNGLSFTESDIEEVKTLLAEAPTTVATPEVASEEPVVEPAVEE